MPIWPLRRPLLVSFGLGLMGASSLAAHQCAPSDNMATDDWSWGAIVKTAQNPLKEAPTTVIQLAFRGK